MTAPHPGPLPAGEREDLGASWRPTPDVMERSRLGAFLRAQGIASLADLQRRSVEDVEWYWDAVVRHLGVRFTEPYRRVLDSSRGPMWPSWFPGGHLNLADNCLDRHVEADRGAHPALSWEGDDGTTRTVDYRSLLAETSRFASALRRLGVGPGDRVGMLLPMLPETAVALLGLARLGAVAVPCFSGYSAPAVASRLTDCGARLLVTADAFPRRGQLVRCKETADEAVRAAATVEHVVVVRRAGCDVPWRPGRDLWWHELTADEPGQCAPVPLPSDHPCLIVYTSGTTGRAKGAVLTQSGFLVKGASDFAWCHDVGERDRLLWVSDLGWLMGPITIAAGLFHGATVVLFEGVPDHPRPDRLWEVVERHRVSVLGLSPTVVRVLMPHGEEYPRRRDLSSLRIFGSTGEPWNPEPYRWLFETVGERRRPIINYTGGTEVSGGLLSCFPGAPIKACGFAGPIPGIAAEVYDEHGDAVRGRVGELVVKAPWPGMTHGFWNDPARYEESYWARWPGVWAHGDWALVDADGCWFLQGRSDDTLKVAGKRIGPAEVESALTAHPAVAEAAAVGVPHEVKGEAIVGLVVLRPGHAPSEALRAQILEQATALLGRALRPERVLFAAELPRTRSGKTMRRVIRATLLGSSAGDLSSLENAGALRAIAEAS